MDDKKRLIIFDANSLIHRAYHALPPLTTSKGELINAVYGFLLVFLKAIRELQPEYIVATFDFPALTFRHQKFTDYKATRPKAPDELYNQIPKVKEILKAFDVPSFEKEGFEADDLIGTIANLAHKKQVLPEIETIILSSDLDTLQLIDQKTKVYTLSRGITKTFLYDIQTLKEKYGLRPEQFPDFKALKGDASDNIPGVPGIGEKTATELIKNFENLEKLYQEIEEETEKAKKIKIKLKETLLNFREQAFFSKNLTEVKRDVPIEFNLEKCRFRGYNKGKVSQVLEKFEFFSLLKRI